MLLEAIPENGVILSLVSLEFSHLLWAFPLVTDVLLENEFGPWEHEPVFCMFYNLSAQLVYPYLWMAINFTYMSFRVALCWENSSWCWFLRRCHLLILWSQEGWHSICVTYGTQSDSLTLLMERSMVSTSLPHSTEVFGVTGVWAPLPGARTLPHSLTDVCELGDLLCVQMSIQMGRDPGSVDTCNGIYFRGNAWQQTGERCTS